METVNGAAVCRAPLSSSTVGMYWYVNLSCNQY